MLFYWKGIISNLNYIDHVYLKLRSFNEEMFKKISHNSAHIFNQVRNNSIYHSTTLQRCSFSVFYHTYQVISLQGTPEYPQDMETIQ